MLAFIHYIGELLSGVVIGSQVEHLEQIVLTDPQCSDCLVHAYVRLEAGAADCPVNLIAQHG